MGLAASGGRISPEASAAGFTTLFVSLYSIADPAGLSVGEVRFVDVALGAGITLLIGAILWPRVGTVPQGMLADVAERARRELAHALVRASGGADGAMGNPRGPLTVLSDLDRVLDTIASDAPSVVPDEERASIVTMISVTVKEALLIGGPNAPRWIGFGAEDRVALTVAPGLAEALSADGARVDAALAARSRRLAGTARPGTAIPAPPDALVDVATARLSDPNAATGPTFDALRIGVGLQRLVWLASRDVEDVAPQAPTATGTLE